MAGDWIPIRCNLIDDPAVLAIAAETGLDEFAVVGRLVRLWAWANQHLSDGQVANLAEAWIDRYVCAPGFARAMLGAGWLQSDAGRISFPRFDRWNSAGAKRRLEKSEQKRAQRSRQPGVKPATLVAGAGDKPATDRRPEKRREEKRTEDKTPPPPAEPGGEDATTPEPKTDPKTEPAAVADGVDDAWDEPFESLVAAWVQAKLPGHDAPGGIQQNSTRRGNWQVRLLDPEWAQRWRQAIERAGRSRALRGEDPDFYKHGLRIDTFLEKANTLTRILEGQFDDRPEGPGPARGGAGRPLGPDRYGHLGDAARVVSAVRAAAGPGPGRPAGGAPDAGGGPPRPG
jgi:hypothetical protein